MANTNPFKTKGQRSLLEAEESVSSGVPVPKTENSIVFSPSGSQKAENYNEKAQLYKANAVADLALKKKETEDRFLEQLEALNSLDWDKMPVPVLARLLMSKPIKQKADEPDFYMSPQQALIYSSSVNFLNVGCDRPELKLNPFLNDVWVDVKTMKINVTVEGQRKIAARRNDLGIPRWKQVERPVPLGTQKPFTWMTQDVGMECTIPVGKESVSATAWMSRWYKPTPIWKDNWEHMLRVRSEGLCYEVITGVGISQPHDDKDVDKVPDVSNVSSTEFKEVKQ